MSDYTKYHSPWADYPNTSTPIIAAALDHIEDGVDTAHQELADHLADTIDAHDASAISVVDAGNYFTGTDVEAALQQLGPATSAASLALIIALG